MPEALTVSTIRSNTASAISTSISFAFPIHPADLPIIANITSTTTSPIRIYKTLFDFLFLAILPIVLKGFLNKNLLL